MTVLMLSLTHASVRSLKCGSSLALPSPRLSGVSQ
ncbi:MAG: hypothetical protein QOC92_4370 [Acidimicrobiaceae bacterium]|jgi:hypothetical protein